MNGTAALSLFKEVFNGTGEDGDLNYGHALQIEEALHHNYLQSEDDGTYWVGACQAVREIRFPVVTPYSGICRLKNGEIVYVRYDSDSDLVEIEQLGIDGEVYGVERKRWENQLTDSLVLLPGGTIYGSEEEAKAGLAVRRGFKHEN